jgi:anti-sigma B factor antagonist
MVAPSLNSVKTAREVPDRGVFATFFGPFRFGEELDTHGTVQARSTHLSDRRRSIMKVTLKTRKVNGIVVMDISGRLCAGQPTLLLHETVRKFIEDGDNNFLINLADVSSIDTSGLGELISTYSLADSHGGAAKLLHLGKKAKDVLQMTKLLTVFDTFTDEVQAIKSFERKTAATA